MVIALLAWLPKWGIKGAALASITGYSVMTVVALFWFLRQQKLSLWECLRPRLEDLPPVLKPANLWEEVCRFTGRAKTRRADVLVPGVD
jgi:hypothetical protein